MATVINLEENIGKTVGKPKPDEDPFVAYARLLRLARPLYRPVPYPRGAFRFKTHEEADQWHWEHITKAAQVSDEIMVELMKSGCGVMYADAIKDAVWREIDGVRIPFASKPTLWKMKQTVREKDIPDRLFLRQQLEAEGIPLDPPPKSPPSEINLPRWLAWLLERIFGKSPR